MMNTNLVEIKGVGPSMAAILADSGFNSIEKIAAAEPAALCEVPGIGAVSASRIIAAAKLIVGPLQAKPAPKKGVKAAETAEKAETKKDKESKPSKKDKGKKKKKAASKDKTKKSKKDKKRRGKKSGKKGKKNK